MTRTARPIETVRGSETILLVEDDASVRELTCDILQSPRLRGSCREWPKPGGWICAIVRQANASCLTDLVMPGMNGAEMADLIVQLRPGIQYSSVGVQRQCVVAGWGSGQEAEFSAETPSQRAFFTNGERNSGWRSEITAGRQNLHTYDS